MTAKKQSPARSKRSGSGSAQAAQSPSFYRVLVLEALQSWVIPTVSLASAFLLWVLAAVGVWSETVAVVGVAGSLLVLTLFASLKEHVFAGGPRRRYAALAFAAVWSLLLFYSFFRFNVPGSPIAEGTLHSGRETLSVSSGVRALVVDGHFVPQQGQGNRSGHYRLEMAPAQGPSHAIDGNFEDTFARQRLGRRGSTTVEVQRTSQRYVERVPADATLRVTEIDPSLAPELHVAVYTATSPWLFTVLGAAGILGALALEKRLEGDGAITMATSVTFFVVDQYLRWASPHPQMRSLIGALLVGGCIGAPLAALLWRVVPRRWIVAHR